MADGKAAQPIIIAGRYRVLEPIGRGGMGKVYKVHDSETNDVLALKMLRRHTADDPTSVERFRREMQAVSQLNHPGIVKVYDAQTDGGRLYYTMEFLDGKTLRTWLGERRQLAFNSVVRVLCLVANALEHVHKVTIHRDLSPENIMVMRDGSIRLLDFGLAKLEDPARHLTMMGQSLGKWQYVAPEQRLNAAQVDHRADIYPLGVMFYEMLTGRLPVAGATIAALRQDAPRGADDFARKAMAGEPRERFESAREFREALQALYEQAKAEAAAPPPAKTRRLVKAERVSAPPIPPSPQTTPPLAAAAAPPRRSLWARIRAWLGMR